MLIPTNCIKICDSKYANLPLFDERNKIQKYFNRKSEEFRKNKAMNSSDGLDGKISENPKIFKKKDASDAFSTFLWSQKINCSAMQSFVGGSIGRVLLGISVLS